MQPHNITPVHLSPGKQRPYIHCPTPGLQSRRYDLMAEATAAAEAVPGWPGWSDRMGCVHKSWQFRYLADTEYAELLNHLFWLEEDHASSGILTLPPEAAHVKSYHDVTLPLARLIVAHWEAQLIECAAT